MKQFTDPAEKREIERNNKIRLIKSEVSGIIYVKSFDHKSKPTVPMPIITISNEMPCKIKQIHTPNTIDVDTNTNGKGSLNMPKDSSLSVNWNDFTTEVAADIQSKSYMSTIDNTNSKDHLITHNYSSPSDVYTFLAVTTLNPKLYLSAIYNQMFSIINYTLFSHSQLFVHLHL